MNLNSNWVSSVEGANSQTASVFVLVHTPLIHFPSAISFARWKMAFL